MDVGHNEAKYHAAYVDVKIFQFVALCESFTDVSVGMCLCSFVCAASVVAPHQSLDVHLQTSIFGNNANSRRLPQLSNLKKHKTSSKPANVTNTGQTLVR